MISSSSSLLLLLQISYYSEVGPPGYLFYYIFYLLSPHSASLETERNSIIEVFISALVFLISKGSFMFSECSSFCFVGAISSVFMKMLMMEFKCFSPTPKCSNLIFLCFFHIRHPSPMSRKCWLAAHNLTWRTNNYCQL